MASNIEKFETDLLRLQAEGADLMSSLFSAQHPTTAKGRAGARAFEAGYQPWYSEALAVVRQLLPDRVSEFRALYEGDLKRKDIKINTYCISDWLLGVRAAPDRSGLAAFDDHGVVAMRFQAQTRILESAQRRFASSLFEIRTVAQADLFDSELEAADELSARGFLRASGVVAGVVLEKHLQQVCRAHQVSVSKQHPTMGDLNEVLKAANVIDVPLWRLIQHLADVRNLCAHNKSREPTETEVSDLIGGVRRVSKILF